LVGWDRLGYLNTFLVKTGVGWFRNIRLG